MLLADSNRRAPDYLEAWQQLREIRATLVDLRARLEKLRDQRKAESLR